MTASRSAWRAMLRHALVASLASAAMATHVAAQSKATRPVVGIALGGGSARGFAHVGVIRWFEEHHVPIDVIAGTSMGGLIGGAYAAGMSSNELAALLRGADWDAMFGASAYGYKSVRRGVGLPTALDNGQQVDFMLSRIGALYAGLPSFDALPTPFRCVAVDLRTVTAVVLDSGSLPAAMRATMSLPGVFPPVELRGQVLVDGGELDNVPADVVRAMGADVVIAVDIGSTEDTSDVRYSANGLVNGKTAAMMRGKMRRSLKSASFVIAPDVAPFGTLDWRKAAALAVSGYNAAQEMSADLLPLAVDDATWKKYLARRAAKRRSRMPAIARLDVRGATAADTRAIRKQLEWQLRQPLNPLRIEKGLLRLDGLERYMSVGWDLSAENGAYVLVVKALRDPRAQPLRMSSIKHEDRP